MKKAPLWSITIWDKRFNGVDKTWQPKVRKYTYLLADELDQIKDPNGDVRILYTGKATGFTTAEKAGSALAVGEIIAIPWGGIPRVQYYKGRFVTGDNRIAVSSDPSVINTEYLYFQLQSKIAIISSFYRGASLKHPSMRDVLKMEIQIPPLDYQKGAVRVLRCIEQQINFLAEQIALLDEQVKSLFNEMFWSISERKPLLVFCNGKGQYGAQSASTQYVEGRPRYVRITDIEEDGSLNDDCVSSINLSDDTDYRLADGDFLFARMGATVGKTYYFHGGDLIFAGYLIRFQLNKKVIDPRFLFWFTKTAEYWDWVKANQSGAAQPGINSKKYAELPIPAANIEKQKAFAERVQQIDKLRFNYASFVKNQVLEDDFGPREA